ncbi:MAG: ATP-dependent metallopeptidase FtsH/Yme1/Tma family protein, partial [Anaerovoracaceae bacterium]
MKLSRNIGIYLMIFALVLTMTFFFNQKGAKEIKEVKFSTFAKEVQDEKVKEINVKEMKLTGTLDNGKIISTYASSAIEINWLNETFIYKQMDESKIEVLNDPPKTTPWYISILPTAIMVLLLVFFWFMIAGQAGGRGAMQFGKNRAKLQKKDNLGKIKFKDVAGLDEEKEELEEVVDFLRRPKKYLNLGARIPKGILLVGPPG